VRVLGSITQLHIYKLIYPSAAKKQARRRWDPPRAARGRPAAVEQHSSDDDLAVDHDANIETRDPTAEELRAARRARMEEFAEYVDLSGTHLSPIGFKIFFVVSGCDEGKPRWPPRPHQSVNHNGKPVGRSLMSKS
jgi:hypothetical protein